MRLSKGKGPLFLAISVSFLLEGRLSLHDFVYDRVLFLLNKEVFRYCEKFHFGEKSFSGNSRFSFTLLVRVVGAIDTFV